jgi:phosphoenolpyruvate-protein phosphotransferase (PTS system enzyme I)
LKANEEKILKGLPISEGVYIGYPYFFIRIEDPVPDFSISEADVESEVKRYREAINKSEKDLVKLKIALKRENSNEAVDILNSHLAILQDPLLTSEIEKRIYKECRNIESIFQDSIIEFKAKFKNIKDGFFQERIKDIVDVSRRILRHLRTETNAEIKKIPLKTAVIAYELVPSDIAEMIDGQVKAFISQGGGVTSHSAIIARSKQIPYVAGIDISSIQKENIEKIIVDGSQGKVIINPKYETIDYYEKLALEKKGLYKDLKEDTNYQTETKDGYPINLFGNIDSIDDIDLLLEYNAAGVGLFRSEYLFLTNWKFPSEDDQFQIYKKLVEKLNFLPLVVRIFDVGGDKNQKAHQDKTLKDLMNEYNPVLGCRAIRFLIRNPNILKTQLRAILRASAYGKVYILIPMVTDVDELFFVRQAIDSVKEELISEGINFEKNIPLGCMIEVPSSAIMSDVIAKEADFLSIGTNDLVQYVLAADRGNPNISDLYSPVHPSILRLIVKVVGSAQEFKKPLILCGEAAAEPKLIPILLGLGIREFSVSVRHIPIIKHTIRKVNLSDALHFAQDALKYTNCKELVDFIQEGNEKYSWLEAKR